VTPPGGLAVPSSARRSRVERLGTVAESLVGFGCTSIRSPLAPAITAARDIGRTSDQRPVPWDGSTTTGRCESCADKWHRVQIEREPRRLFEGADASLAENHVAVALASTYSAASSHSSTVEDILASRERASRPAHLLQERVSSACSACRPEACPRSPASCPRLQGDDLADHSEARLLPGCRQHAKSRLSEARSCRERFALEGAAAEDAGAREATKRAVSRRSPRPQRAGSGHHNQLSHLRPHRRRRHGVAGLELAAGQLEGLVICTDSGSPAGGEGLAVGIGVPRSLRPRHGPLRGDLGAEAISRTRFTTAWSSGSLAGAT